MTAASVAAAIDVRTGRIPNALVAATALVGLSLTAFGWSGGSFGASVAGLLLGAALMLPGHLVGGTGAGDVKLVAALGTLVGPQAIVMTWIYSAIAGGVLACMVAMRRGQLRRSVTGAASLMAGKPEAATEIRSRDLNRFALGPAILAGTVMALIGG